MSILADALTCLPLWLVAAMLLCVVLAFVRRKPRSRSVWLQWAGVFAFVLATSWFWADPRQMLRGAGPLTGRVVDADTGKPVPYAVLVFHWRGDGWKRERYVGLATDAARGGRYRLPWQGFANWRIGAQKLPGTVEVVAPGYGGGSFSLDRIKQGAYAEAPPDTHPELDSMPENFALASGGIVRLHRLRPDEYYISLEHSSNHMSAPPLEPKDVARRFYAILYPALCPGPGKSASLPATTYAFRQLVEAVSRLEAYDGAMSLPRIDIGALEPSKAIDKERTAAWCRRLRLEPPEPTA